jgi:urease accessory protein
MKSVAGILAGGAALAASTNAYAHHGMHGDLPSTFGEGLISGLAHPVIGIDHMAFVVAAGVIAGVTGLGRLAPLSFVAASIAGILVHLAALEIPGVELIIALSVIAVGGLLAVSSGRLGALVWVAIFAVVGVFHGYAFGESIVGAESTPIIAYLIGLFAMQSLITVAAYKIARSQSWLPHAVKPRLVGAAAFGVG